VDGQLPLFDSRAEQIFRRFVEFHTANPAVWKLFQRFALQLAAAGRTRYSVDAVFHRIRWHVDIETNTSEAVKLNDHYTAYYARMFMVKYPQHQLFELRKRTSAQRPAYEHDIAVIDVGPAINESILREQLRRLM